MTDEKKILPSSFVKLSYEVYDEENNKLYSTTIQKEGTNEVIEQPVVIKIGDKEVFFEEELLGVKEGEVIERTIPPERAFGKRDPKKIVRIPIRRLRAITGRRDFHVGEELYTQDNKYFGRIIHVGSREVTIDTNHPLAGKTLKLKAKIFKIVNPEDSDSDKIDIILERHFGQFYKDIKTSLVENKLKIYFAPEKLTNLALDTMIRYIYIPRRTAAKEIMTETSIKKVLYEEEYATEIEITPPKEPETPEEATVKAKALAEISKEEEEIKEEENKEKK